MNDLESLIIYKQYVEMIYYTLNILEKYPKVERFSLVSSIKETTYAGLKEIIKAQKEYNKTKRLEHLNNLDVELKTLKVLVRVSYKKKNISPKNYTAWSKKITNISNLMGGWMKSCATQ